MAAAIVLHVMFFAGGFALFLQELESWQHPGAAPAAQARAASAREPAALGARIEDALGRRGARPTRIDASLPREAGGTLDLFWSDAGSRERKELHLDPNGAEVSERSRLGTILYYLHFLYHPRATWGMYVAGVLGVGLLLALLTGVIIHLKDIVRQFHQFRPQRTPRVFWSDLHKVTGVMGLPFQVMYAFTGALICLAGLLLSGLSGPVFASNESAAIESFWGSGRESQPAGKPAATLGPSAVLSAAAKAVPGIEPTYLRIEHIGDAGARARVWGEGPGLFARGSILLDATNGQVLVDNISRWETPGVAVSRWIQGLHYGLFGGLGLKVLYALLAGATCLTLLSGNWIWLLRRRARQAAFGNRLLARLTIGVGGGILPATAALFWANRLFPDGQRPAAEAWVLFGSWALVALVFLARSESSGGWVGLLGLAGLGFVTLPVGSLLSASQHLFNYGTHGRTEVLGVELGLVLLGALLLATAAAVRLRERATAGARATEVHATQAAVASAPSVATLAETAEAR